jgi:hypothetical protein
MEGERSALKQPFADCLTDTAVVLDVPRKENCVFVLNPPKSPSLAVKLAQLTILAMCIEFAAAVSPGTCVGVSTNVIDSQPTTLPAMSNTRLELSDPLPATASDDYVFVSYYEANTGTGEIRFYSMYGDLRFTTTTGLTLQKSVILKDPLKLFSYSQASDQIKLSSMTVVGTTFTLGGSAVISTDSSVIIDICKSEAATNYIYCLGMASSVGYRYRINVWSNTLVTTNSENTGKLSGLTYMDFTNGGSQLFYGKSAGFVVYNKADATLIQDLTIFNTTFYPWAVDNLNSAVIFYAAKRNRIKRFGRIDLATAGSSGFVNAGANIELSNQGYGGSTNNILNFGPYQYVVTTSKNALNMKMLFFYKTDLSIIYSIPLPLTTVKAMSGSVGTLAGGLLYSDNWYFAFVESNKKNFQSYYVTVNTVDYCANRGLDLICVVCQTGYYRNNELPNNECIEKNLISSGMGVDEANNLVKMCLAPYCIDCLDDYATCVEAEGYLEVPPCYVYNPLADCLLQADMPARFGGDDPSGIAVPCTDPNCLACFAAHATCTACDTAANFFLNTTSNACVSNSTLPNGKGPNLATGVIASCSLSNCLTCKASFAECQACNTAALYYLNETSKTCIYYTSIPNTYGAYLANGTIQPCQDSKCLTCQASTLICTSCNTTANYWLNTTDKTCVYYTDIIDRFGANHANGQITSCQDANCINCKSDRTMCTACDTSLNYWLNTATHVCTYYTAIADRFGADTSTGSIAACSDSNCLQCKADITLCTGCDTSLSYYLNTNSSACLLLTTIPDYNGANLVSGQVALCSDPNCIQCQANYLQCTACDFSADYYLYQSSHACLANASLPDGKGPDLTNKIVVSCQDSTCKNCRANYLECSSCDTANNYYLDVPTKTCLLDSTIPDTFGANTATGIVVACQDLHCKKCQADYQACTACDTTANYWLNTTDKTCVYYTDIIDRFGANHADGKITSCQDVNCIKCKDDVTVCSACDTSLNYWLNTATHVCTYYTAIADRFGADTSTGSIAACSDSNCLQCKADITLCTGCDTSLSYYLNTNSSACLLLTTIPDYNGANLVSGQVALCSDPNCIQCQANYLQCTACDFSADYYLEQSTFSCLLNSTLPNRKGPDLTNKIVVDCLDTACLNCRANYQECSQCDTASSYYLDTNLKACVLATSIPDAFGANTATGIVVTCQDLHCKKCQVDYQQCTACDTNSLYYLDTVTKACIFYSSIPDTKGADLATGFIALCSVSHCLNCKSNSSRCNGCDTVAGYYLDQTSNTCVHYLSIADFYGADLSLGTVESCSVANCLDCKASHLACARCNVAGSYFKNVSSGDCVFISSIPSGKGANATTGIYETCWTSNCKNCQSDSATCQVCDVINGYFKNTTDGQCQFRLTIADYFGPDINTGFISPCTDGHCKLCKQSNADCDLCDVASHYYFNDSTLTCMLSWDIESGYGGKASDGLVYPCDSPGCNNCSANYLQCAACDTAASYYLDTAAQRCILVNQIPNGYGAKTSDGTITACQDAQCLECQADYTMCTACDVPNLYFLDPATKTCVLLFSIPAGYGANSTTGIMETCRPTNCLLCQSDSSKCGTCNTAANYFLNTTSFKCTLNSSIVDSYGPNLATGAIDLCSDANCLDCKYQVSDCASCDVANLYYLNTSTQACVLQSDIPIGSGVKAADGTVAFCQDTHCKKCQADYSKCEECKTAAKYYLNNLTKTCIHETAIADFSGANLTTGVIGDCAVSHCRKCQVNSQLCVQCDTTTLYFMRNSTGTCVFYMDIEDSYGADINTGRIARCQDLNCLKCQAATEQCLGCDMNNGYFLNTTLMGCVTLQSIAGAYGGDLVSGIIVPCNVVGCIDCRIDYTTCTVCDTANHYFLNTTSSTCVVDSTLPDHFGPNLVDGYIEECVVFGCRVCNMDSNNCQICMTSLGYYKDSSNQCILNTDIQDFKGADTVLGTISSCQLAGCKYCKKDFTKCTGCDTSMGLYLNADGNTCTNTFPDGFGPDESSGSIKACSDSNCKICSSDFAACELCDSSNYYYLDGSSCSPASKAPKGMGLNKTTSLLEMCSTEFCEVCRKDYHICTDCYENMGYYLEGNLCVLMDAKLEVKESSVKAKDASMSIFVATTPSLEVDKKFLYAELKKHLDWNITFLKSSTEKPEQVDLKMVKSALESGVTLDLNIQSVLSEKSYLVNVSFTKKYYNVTLEDGSLLRISTGRGQFSFKDKTAASAEQAQGAADSGTAINNAMGGSLSSSPAFMPAMMTVVALDPTGVLMKFNQILKIINKLYFININYGTRLEAFLKGMGEQTGNLTKEESDRMMKQVDKYRGKLTKEKVRFDFLYLMTYKVGLYMAVWALWIVHYALEVVGAKVSKWYLHVMYWCGKVHLIIFNLVFIDFIWYGSHALMHARGQNLAEQIIVFICLLLTTFDVSLVIANVASQRDWLYWILLKRKIESLIAEEKKSMHFEEVRKKREKHKQSDKVELDRKNKIKGKEENKKMLKKAKDEIDSDDEEDIPEKKKKGQDKARSINYPRTYEELASNHHLYVIASVNLAPLARVYLNPMTRLVYMNHVFRTIIYQGTILACQYSSGMAITILIIVEISRISYTTFFYVKYKYLKNIICLLMEVMQSSLLLCFLLLAMILHPKESDEIILDFYQDAGIWIVIASCVAEYLLLLTYIGVAAYDFFKNRKSTNRAKARLKYSFIKYGVDPVEMYHQKHSESNGFLPSAITPLKSTEKMPHVLPVDTKKPITNYSELRAAIESSSSNIQIAENKGMQVTSIIGKSKNKFQLSEYVKNKLELRNQDVAVASPFEDGQSRKSTSNSLKKVSPPIKTALKRIQNTPAVKPRGQISPSTHVRELPTSLVFQEQTLNNLNCSTLLKEAGSPPKKTTKLSSLLELFNKKPN